MMKVVERRAIRREACRIPMEWSDATLRWDGEVKDLSPAAICVLLPSEAEARPLARVRVRLEIDDGARQLEAGGAILYTLPLGRVCQCVVLFDSLRHDLVRRVSTHRRAWIELETPP